jgi:uncharacterized Zn finger protein
MASKKADATFPRITEAAIRSRVGEASFTRGQSYFREARIHATRRRGLTLEARCHGSRDESYRLSATFGPKGIDGADCSCPVGSGGHCKHVAAMLLTWLSMPNAFGEVEEIAVVLDRRTKPELIALIELMIRNDPDLEEFIELTNPATAAGKADGPPSTEPYRRRTIEAFRKDESIYGSDPVAEELEILVEIGDALLEQKNPLGASAVYRGILEGVFKEYESYRSGYDEVDRPVEGCVLGLGLCLSELTDHREPLFRSLFDVYAFDVAMGGTGFGGDPMEIARPHATEAERAMIARWAIDAARDASRPYQKESFESLYSELEPDADIATSAGHAGPTSGGATEAIRLNRKQAETLIGRRTRASYVEACEYLKKIKKVGTKADVTRELSEIRNKYRTLRALLTEMDRAGL